MMLRTQPSEYGGLTGAHMPYGAEGVEKSQCLTYWCWW